MRDYRTRLRWYKKEESIVSEPVMCGSEIVRAFIYPQNGNFKIKDVNERYIFASGSGDSVAELKTKSKQRLVLMAAKFFDEVRLKSS